jgi:hypothetical protein
VQIIWGNGTPPKITGRIMRTMDKHIAAFVKEHHRRPCCGICFLTADACEVRLVLFEPFRELEAEHAAA